MKVTIFSLIFSLTATSALTMTPEIEELVSCGVEADGLKFGVYSKGCTNEGNFTISRLSAHN